jgi:hypothetical protein
LVVVLAGIRKHDYLPEMLKMLQAWEEFLAQKPVDNVVLIKKNNA